METGKLYRVKRENYQGNTGNYGALIFKGATVNVTVKGSNSQPAALANMVVFAERSAAITSAGIYPYTIFPEYIAITGTVSSIEIVGYTAELVGDIQ